MAIATVGLQLELPLGLLVLFVAIAAASNSWAQWWPPQRASPAQVGGSLLLLDVFLLTGILSITGGPLNPFSMMYLVYITLAAVVLGAWWTWTITLAAAVGFGALFVAPLNEHSPLSHALSGQLEGHLQGMWWAFAAAALLTASFVVRLANAIDERDRQLEAARERAMQSERLASLTTLAAGAAHELGTPLSTIAVAAGELDHALAARPDLADARDDLRLIQQELGRARNILDRLAVRTGEPAGEMPRTVSVASILSQACDLLSADDRGRVSPRVDAAHTIHVPPVAFAQTLAGLMRNGIDADGHVTVEASSDRAETTITVSDSGTGIPSDILPHVTEPFFTTKAPGKGMGLGLFLAHLLVTDLGGQFTIESTVGRGTTVRLRLPTPGSQA